MSEVLALALIAVFVFFAILCTPVVMFAFINLVYRVNRTYWSQDLDFDPPGVMGDKQYNDVTIDRS